MLLSALLLAPAALAKASAPIIRFSVDLWNNSVAGNHKPHHLNLRWSPRDSDFHRRPHARETPLGTTTWRPPHFRALAAHDYM